MVAFYTFLLFVPTDRLEPSYDYSGLIFTLISLLITSFYLVAFLVKYITTEYPEKIDYLFF